MGQQTLNIQGKLKPNYYFIVRRAETT